MNLDALKTLLAPKGRRNATVAEVVGDHLVVVAGGQRARVSRAPGDATAYAVGDKVSVESGIVRGRRSTGEVYQL